MLAAGRPGRRKHIIVAASSCHHRPRPPSSNTAINTFCAVSPATTFGIRKLPLKVSTNLNPSLRILGIYPNSAITIDDHRHHGAGYVL